MFASMKCDMPISNFQCITLHLTFHTKGKQNATPQAVPIAGNRLYLSKKGVLQPLATRDKQLGELNFKKMQ